MPRPAPPALRLAAALILPPTRLLMARRWLGAEHLPATGGVVVAVNHVSNLDPLLVGDFLWSHGAPPSFLAKSELFSRAPVAAALRAAGQVEVLRESELAADALGVARERLDAGGCVVVFPEGTFTRDPDLWPMTARPGAARLALETGVPLVPVVVWGGQRVVPPFTRRFHPLPRRAADVVAGRPMGRAELLAAADPAEQDPEVLARAATVAVTDRLTAMLAVVRDEKAPGRRWDVRRDGDPHPRRVRG